MTDNKMDYLLIRWSIRQYDNNPPYEVMSASTLMNTYFRLHTNLYYVIRDLDKSVTHGGNVHRVELFQRLVPSGGYVKINEWDRSEKERMVEDFGKLRSLHTIHVNPGEILV